MMPKAHSTKALWTIIVVLVLLIAAGVGAAFWYMRWAHVGWWEIQAVETNTNTSQPKEQAPATTTTKTTTIEWQVPQQIADQGLVKSAAGARPENGYFQVGSVVAGDYKGGTVILWKGVPYEGVAFGDSLFRFIKKDSKFYLLKKLSSDLPTDEASWDGNLLQRDKFTIDTVFTVADFDFPKTLTPAGKGVSFELIGQPYGAFFDLNKSKKVFVDSVLGDVYMSETDHGFHARAVDGTDIVYKMLVPFMSTKNVPNITWTDHTRNTQEYTYQTIGGCGASDYLAVVYNSMEDGTLDAYVQAGVASNGSKIYVEKNSADYGDAKQAYEDGYFLADGQTKPTYTDYLAQHPFIYWVDPFGRLVKMQSNKFVPQAECGKPVIYLYPTTTQKVTVQVAPQGGFTKTEPAYNGMWKVSATPEGKITDLTTGKPWPYLFWEGRGDMYATPKQGFVVKKAEVQNFLVASLKKYAFNDKEIADFLEFWLPQMQTEPYYFITFMSNPVMDQLAPLNISPKPDTVIRVLMDFTPLQKPMAVQGYDIPQLTRKGFTVMEWGGVRRPR